MHALSPRQVHLDFHTSPLIPGIGENFSKENFQKALLEGHVSSITLFAKCHHGQCYYPTKVGTMHPHLHFDLLGQMIEAAHEVGVRAPIYITAGWSAQDAERHPEWRVLQKDGAVSTMNYDLEAKPEEAKPDCSWINLCLNDGSYCNHIYDLTREICDRYPVVDGLFYDICCIGDQCYCAECVEGMKKLGMNPELEEDAKAYYILKRQSFMKKCADILHEKHPDATIFFNSGGADQYRPQYHPYQTHFEMEDLPTVWGGYDKMPARAKFFAKTGKGYLGMTGKFHTSWGEFGGYKSKEALKFETASMMAYGACCSVGDQLHPDGCFDMETYRNLGYAYGYLEKIEEYCLNAQPVTSLGVYLSGNTASDEGLVKMLLETQTDFDIVYQDQLQGFDTVIFPDTCVISDECLANLQEYIQNGGKVIFSGDSLIREGKFQVDVGAVYQGASEFTQDYLTVGEAVSANMVKSPILCYSSGNNIEATDGEVLATITLPYFNRTYGTYCSHKNTPYDKSNGGHPAMVRKGNVIYLAHKIFEMYYEYGSVFHRNYFKNALDLLYTENPLEIALMSAGRAAFTHQPAQKRYCLNLLYASPIRRNQVEVIEDLPTIYEIPVTVTIPQKVTKVFLPVSGTELPFVQNGNKVSITVSSLNCHEIVVFTYEGEKDEEP